MWTVIGCISRFGCPSGLPEGVPEAELPQFIYGSFAGIALTVFNLVPSVTNMLGKGALTCIAAARERRPLCRWSAPSQALLTSAAYSRSLPAAGAGSSCS